MTDKKFTQFPSVSASTISDIIWAVQGGSDVQETLGQVIDLVRDNLIPTNPGDPNGSVAGDQYQLLWDTTNNFLWICTTTGSSATAVWKPCIGQATNGQLPIGRTGDSPVLGTITAGTNITVTNGPGTIQIDASGSAALTWHEVTASPHILHNNSGHVVNTAGLCTLVLPALIPQFDVFQIAGYGAGGWILTQNAGQQIHVGANATTLGVGGSLASTNQYDSIYLVCTVANTQLVAVGAPQGVLTIV